MKKCGVLATVLLATVIAICGCGNSTQSLSEEQDNVQNVQNIGQGRQTEGIQETASTPLPYEQPEMKGEITVSCFYEEEFLRVSAEKFMKIYPDVKVTINSYQGEGGVNAVENYLTYLNTKIMTGKAEDILFTTYLPITKYSEMGVFEDLSPYVSSMPEFNEENYFMNVLLAAKEKSGELYLLPYMARFQTIGFSKELLSGHKDFEKELSNEQSHRFSSAMAIAKQLVDDTDRPNAFLTLIGEVDFAHRLFQDSLRQFIDVEKKEVKLDTPEYIELLKYVKDLLENGYFESGLDFYNVEYYLAAIVDLDVQAAFYSLDENAGDVYCMPIADAAGSVSISANSCVSLNSASENKKLAWEFIRYMLSEEAQTQPSVLGAAVNRQGFEAAVERYYGFYSNGNKNTSIKKEAYHDVLETWMNQINDCDTLDPDILWMVDEENSKYFSGQQTAEDTASNLQRQLEQYFNE